ncbi:MAG TPA: tetratricopeptide repeat protein [Vicinamibacterales bacterium]|nr:tetratricopeptide repeat protein [Vicinamibacterales bacterium]
MTMRTILVVLFLCLLPVRSAAQSSGRILVMPFENPRRDARLHWIGEAAALLLADDLNSRGLAAIARAERIRAFEQLHLPPTATLSRATVIKVGEFVGASEIVVGSVAVDGSALIVEAHSIRIDVGRLQPNVTERGVLSEVFAVFEAVARRLAPEGRTKTERPVRPPLEAFEQYVKGLMAESAAARVTFLEGAVRLNPGYDRALLALWGVRGDQGDHAAALAAARGVAAGSPRARQATFAAAVSLLELHKYEEAYTAFKALAEAAGMASFTASAYNNLGIVQLRRGATSQTGLPTYFLTKAADADPGDSDVLFNLGYAYVLERNHQGGIYWLRETLRRNPADADAHYVLGAALAASGSAVEAAREKELARQLSSEYAELEKRAAAERLPVPRGLERVRGDPDLRAAIRPEQSIVNSAQREQLTLATFHLDRGRRLFEREEDRQALAELRRAVYLSPYEAQAHLLMARIHLRAGRTTDAVDALKISIWSAETAAARIAMAEAYLKQKNPAAARTELARALVLDPSSAEAKRLLASVPAK